MKRYFLVLILALSLTTPLVVPTSVSAQTKAEARTCFDKFNGIDISSANPSNRIKTLRTQYQNSKCSTAKGGNCTLAGSGQGATLNCKEPDDAKKKQNERDRQDRLANRDSDTIKDPALSGRADCTEDSCNLISNYINPFITLLTVLVGLAITIGIIFGGIRVAMSAGDPQANASGKDHIRNALIAAVAYALLYALLQWLIPGGFL